MKTRSLLVAMLITASAVSFAFGNDNPAVVVVSLKGSEVVKVIYKGVTQGKVRLNIFDSSGRMIHSEAVYGKEGFIYPLNFKGLRSGVYTIEIVDDLGRHQESVAYRPVSEMKSIHVSKLLGDDAKFLFSVSNAQEEPISIKVYDAFRNLVHAEERTVKGDFAQVYRIESPRGRYTFEVADRAGNKRYFSF